MSRTLNWQHLPSAFAPRTYICGYCGDKVGPNRGYFAYYSVAGRQRQVNVYICSSCSQPTFFDPEDRRWPGAAFGASVQGLPAAVEALYDEARAACRWLPTTRR